MMSGGVGLRRISFDTRLGGSRNVELQCGGDVTVLGGGDWLTDGRDETVLGGIVLRSGGREGAEEINDSGRTHSLM